MKKILKLISVFGWLITTSVSAQSSSPNKIHNTPKKITNPNTAAERLAKPAKKVVREGAKKVQPESADSSYERDLQKKLRDIEGRAVEPRENDLLPPKNKSVPVPSSIKKDRGATVDEVGKDVEFYEDAYKDLKSISSDAADDEFYIDRESKKVKPGKLSTAEKNRRELERLQKEDAKKDAELERLRVQEAKKEAKARLRNLKKYEKLKKEMSKKTDQRLKKDLGTINDDAFTGMEGFDEDSIMDDDDLVDPFSDVNDDRESEAEDDDDS